jgi:hypothetical protein
MGAGDVPLYRIDVDDAERCITVTITPGAIYNDEVFLENFSALRAVPQYSEGYSVVIDATEMAGTLVTGEALYQFANTTEQEPNLMAIAVRDPRAVGLSKLLELRLNVKQFDRVAVFTDTQQARSWLGLPERKPPAGA